MLLAGGEQCGATTGSWIRYAEVAEVCRMKLFTEYGSWGIRRRGRD